MQAIVASDPSDELLDRASDAGVMFIAELSTGNVLNTLRSIVRRPAVAIAVLPDGTYVDSGLRSAAPNVLLAQRIDPQKMSDIAGWAQVIFCDANDVEAFGNVARSSTLPVVAWRQLKGSYTLVEARRECDILQRDLALRVTSQDMSFRSD